MNYIIRSVLCLILLLVGTSYAEESPRYTVFSEYVRQLATMQELQDTASKELKETTNRNRQMATMIRSSTRIKLELSRNIAVLKSRTLAAPYDFLIPNIISLYQEKIELHDTLIQIASEFMAGPKPNVDYGKMAAEMPKITATLEYTDKALYSVTPGFCLMLVDDKADSQGRLSHLIITKAQRKQLVASIDTTFGKRLREKNPAYTIGSAVLIRDFLLGKHKSSDDPW